MADGDGLKITEIPIILGPENWSTVDERYITDPHIDTLRGVHSEMLRTYESIVLTHRDVMRDPMQTPTANLKRSHDNAAKVKGRVLEAAETKLSRMREQIAAIDEATSRVPEPPSDAVMKITSDRLFALSPADRTARIREAIQNDQRGTLAVALRVGDAWVHGLTEAERAMHLDAYRRKFYPQALERREASVRALEIVTNAIKAYVERIDKLYDAGKIHEAGNAAAAAQQRLANGR